MRRPRKPFVTEYKTPNRRQPGGLDLADGDHPGAKDVSDPFERGPDRGDQPMDAAMRAADALFARAGEPLEASRPDLRPDMPSGLRPGDGDEAGAKPAGRILRALDEAPDLQMTALEVERAPKRRGRKPGSKNKPKAGPARASQRASRAAAQEGDDVAAELFEAPEADADAVASGTAGVFGGLGPSRWMAEQRAARSCAAARGLWKRDRLKPWESWKRRRLPRVCW